MSADKNNCCFVCGRVVEDSWPAFRIYEKKAVVCMGCEGEEIEVWRVSLVGESGGYVDRSFHGAVGVLENMDIDDSFEVHKEMMLGLEYLRLGEFQGF